MLLQMLSLVSGIIIGILLSLISVAVGKSHIIKQILQETDQFPDYPFKKDSGISTGKMAEIIKQETPIEEFLGQ